jgi:antitoxin YefM
MISGIREKTVVKEGGKIEISSPDLPIGTEVEVIVLVEEQDATEYLLSTEANRRHLEQALKDLENPENLIYVNLEDFEEGSPISKTSDEK